MANLTLGLDLGPNSIGWALIDEETGKIVDLGVRVFPEGVDNFDSAKEVSRNEDRRVARGMRRQTQRRRRRARILQDALIQARLLPEDPDDRAELIATDPYELRARALQEKLAPHQIGRVLLHLSQRRGFLSNRKKDRGDKEVQGMLAEINELDEEINATNKRSLGELLHEKIADLDHTNRTDGDHVRNRHTRRSMYEDEFEAIWEAQRGFGHADLLTERLKYGSLGRQEYPSKPRRRPKGESLLDAFGLHGLIFFQRKMYWPKSAIGLCELEPKQPRCPRADRRAQRFRLLHEVNNLRYIDDRVECKLDDQQRTLLLDKLGKSERMTFVQIRNALGFLESVKFNLEKGQRPSLQGAIVDWRMAKAVGKSWHDRPEDDKDEIVRVLLDNEREDKAVLQRAQTDWGMTGDDAEAAMDVDFPSGHLSLSLKAINRLLPHMEKGLVYQADSDPENSALHAAGYLRRDELQRRIFDTLPDPKRSRQCPVGDVPNPVVKRTLVELRKLVNAILRQHGKPAAIHVEMGRDVKTRPQRGTEAYRKYQQKLAEMRQNEERRDAAALKLRENGIRVTRDAILRYLLWEDQRHECIYSGTIISFEQLFGGEVDVDHILPRSRCLDDSQNNKVVCFRKANADKRQRTPNEWLAESQPERYDQICQRAGKLMRDGYFGYPKYKRFLQKELKLDDFIARQLNDTRYIAKATAEYLRCLFDADHHVLGVKGQLTAELRHHWGIGTLLAELPDSPAWAEAANLRPGEKNRADHRHHAIDAVVIALTHRSRLQELSRIRQAGGTKATGEMALDPWLSFRDDLKEAVGDIKVSHRSERQVSGQLHEDTLYGPTAKEGHWVARKPIESLSPNEIESIRDKGIQRIIIDRLREHGIEFGRGKKVDAKTWKQALVDLRIPPKKERNKHKPGVPIKRVRVVKPEQTIRPIRKDTPDTAFVKPGSTHHLCLFEFEENGKTKRDAVFVTMLEAAGRIRQQQQRLAEVRKSLVDQGVDRDELKRRLNEAKSKIAQEIPIIQRTHPERPEARFLMSLSRGEMVLADWKGQERLLVFRTAASTQGQIYFVEHTDARRSTDQKKFVANANTLNARKVTVDPLGRIRWAND